MILAHFTPSKHFLRAYDITYTTFDAPEVGTRSDQGPLPAIDDAVFTKRTRERFVGDVGLRNSERKLPVHNCRWPQLAIGKPQSKIASFIPQRHHRLHSRCSPRWDIGRQDGNGCHGGNRNE